jgi:hypothetical protein
MKNWGSSRSREALAAAASEALFVLLPIVVAVLAFQDDGRWTRLLASPIWSVSAAILFGHVLANIASLAVLGAAVDRLAVVLAAVVVLGLVPALLMLLIALRTEYVPWLSVAQIVLFGTSLLVSLVTATLLNLQRSAPEVDPTVIAEEIHARRAELKSILDQVSAAESMHAEDRDAIRQLLGLQGLEATLRSSKWSGFILGVLASFVASVIWWALSVLLKVI